MAAIESIEDHTLYLPPLGAGSVVFDLGANRGRFALEMVTRFGCQVYAFEPSPDMFPGLPVHPRIASRQVAVTGEAGTVPFYISVDPLGSTLHPARGDVYAPAVLVDAQPLEALARDAGVERIDVLKLDIEGSELDVLDGCSDAFLKGIGQITVEFHDFNDVTPVPEVVARVERLERLGFLVYKKSWQTWCDVLFINRAYVRVPLWPRLWDMRVRRYAVGAFRTVQKRMA